MAQKAKGRAAVKANERQHVEEAAQRLKSYSAVVSGARLDGLRLVRSRFEWHPKSKDPRLEYHLKEQAIDIDTEKQTGFGVFTWYVAGLGDDDKAEMEIECAYLVEYSGTGTNELPAKQFISKVGAFTSYPYFRSFVSQISWASGLELPVLPLLKG